MPEDHVARVADLGMSALALTEHGNLSSVVKLNQAAQKHGIRPVYGVEAYTAPVTMKTDKNQRKWHQTILASDQVGYRNLMQLVGRSWSEEGFYRWPTVTSPMLRDHSEGLIVTSGCADSLLACTLLGGKGIEKGDIRAAEGVLRAYQRIFGDRYYLEVQRFPQLDRTCTLNAQYERWSREFGVPLVATADVHYPLPSDNDMQKILHAAGRNTGTVEAAEAAWEYNILLTYPETDYEIWDHLRSTGLSKSAADAAIDNTSVIAGRCDVELPVMDRLIYPFEADGAASEVELLRRWLNEGWAHRQMSGRAARERVEYEVEQIVSKGFVSYFLHLADAIRWAKRQGIAVGPGRGSGAASLVLYLLQVSEVNSLDFPLILFERFIAPDRDDLPDVDIDFESERRDEVRRYMVGKYGEAMVGNVGTLTYYRGKNSVQSVGRVHEVPFAVCKKVSDMIVDSDDGDQVAKTRELFPVVEEIFQQYPELAYAERLEGNVSGFGVHAAGIVVGSQPLHNYTTTYEKHNVGKSKKTVQVLSVDKYDSESLGLLKDDFLGLKTMSVISIAAKMIGLSMEEVYQIPLDDPEVLEGFRRGWVGGVFQFEGSTTRDVCVEIQPQTFMDLAHITSLSRPGPLHGGSTADFIRSRRGEAGRDRYPDAVEGVLSSTEGEIVYQEQVIMLARSVGGFDAAGASKVRSIISKKKGQAAFAELYDSFLEGATERGVSAEVAAAIWRKMVTSGAYSFCCTGDTVVERAGANRHGPATITLADLYAAQQSKTPVGEKIRDPKRGVRLLQMQDDGRIRPARLLKVHDPVSKPILKITTAGGRSFRCSTEHNVLTAAGYRLVTNLSVGDELVIEMAMESKLKGRDHHALGGTLDGWKGEGNPGWIDGRSIMLREAQEKAAARSGGVCERSDCDVTDAGSHSLEFAHIVSLEALGGDYSRYHSAGNLAHLCNHHHKLLDYSKGERVARWTRGRPTGVDPIVSIEDDGFDLVYDVSMERPAHNYVGNGVVHHNNVAHAVSYSVLSVWCMWLRVHHPLAYFYARLMANVGAAKDAKTKIHPTETILKDMAASTDIKVLSLDPLLSNTDWTVEDGALRPGFRQPAGIGADKGDAIVAWRSEAGRPGVELEWADLVQVKGIGPTTVAALRAFAEDPDPFGVGRIGRNTVAITEWLTTMPDMPVPDKLSTDIPYTEGLWNGVLLGVVQEVQFKDLFESHRNRTGQVLNPDDVKDPHLAKSASLYLEDVRGRFKVNVSRFAFPRYQAELERLKVQRDYALVSVGKSDKFPGKTTFCNELYIIEPDD